MFILSASRKRVSPGARVGVGLGWLVLVGSGVLVFTGSGVMVGVEAAGVQLVRRKSRRMNVNTLPRLFLPLADFRGTSMENFGMDILLICFDKLYIKDKKDSIVNL
jgi:hypothetical protein